MLGPWLMLFCFSFLKTSSLLCVYSKLFSCWLCSQPHSCVLSPFIVSDSVGPHGLWDAMLLCPWDSPVENPGVGCSAPNFIPSLLCVVGGWGGSRSLVEYTPGIIHTLGPFTLVSENMGDDWQETGEEVEKKVNTSPPVTPTSCLWRHS